MNRDRITAARQRLTEALRAGQDTASLRQTIAQLESAAQASAAHAEQCTAALAYSARSAFEARAAVLAAECRRQANQPDQVENP